MEEGIILLIFTAKMMIITVSSRMSILRAIAQSGL
jgi:hypothetical protein